MQYTFDWSVIWRYRGTLLHGLALTLLLSLAGLAAALAIGMIAGAGGASRRPALKTAALVYVELARNVPLLVHIYFWYLALSALRLPAFWCGVLALAIYSGAYVAEIVRAGIQACRPASVRPHSPSDSHPPRPCAPSSIPKRSASPPPRSPGCSRSSSRTPRSPRSSRWRSCPRGRRHRGETFRKVEAYITITLLYFLVVTAVSRAALFVFGRRGAEVDRRFQGAGRWTSPSSPATCPTSWAGSA